MDAPPFADLFTGPRHDPPNLGPAQEVCLPWAFMSTRRLASQRITRGRISWIEGSHLFPFEQPGKTVDAVLGWIARLDRAVAD